MRELAALTADADALVAVRALDLLEKLAREHAPWVQPHRRVFIGQLAESDRWEIRLRVVRALPRLAWTARERARVLAILRRDCHHSQTFVRAWALDGLAILAEGDADLRPLVVHELEAFERSGKKALAARGRKIGRRPDDVSASPEEAGGRLCKMRSRMRRPSFGRVSQSENGRNSRLQLLMPAGQRSIRRCEQWASASLGFSRPD